jgi:hypothetical protein
MVVVWTIRCGKQDAEFRQAELGDCTEAYAGRREERCYNSSVIELRRFIGTKAESLGGGEHTMEKPLEKNLIKMRTYAEKFAEKSGTYLHPDHEVTRITR